MKRGAIFLTSPPDAIPFADWYLKPVAEVSLLLRNVLSLQRAGWKDIWVIAPQSLCHGEERARLERALEDPRVRVQTTFADVGDWELWSDAGNKTALFHGSDLHDKGDLMKIQKLPDEQLPSDYQMISMGAEQLREFAESLQFPAGVSEGGEGTVLAFRRPDSELRSFSDFASTEEAMLQACGLSNDSFGDRLVTRHVSRFLTRRILKTSASPNEITLWSLVIGMASALCFLQGGYWGGLTGALLLQISAWVDCVDGEVARLKFMESKIGGELDILCDNIVHVSIFFCMGMGLYFETQNDWYRTFGALAVMGNLLSFSILSSGIIEQKSKASASTSSAPSSSKKPEDELANRDFTYFLLIFALLGQTHLFIGLTAIGANVFAAYLIYSRWKASKDASQA